MTSPNIPIKILKIGGNQVEDSTFLAGFVSAVEQLRTEYAVVVVHGGGKEISDLHTQLGVTFETVEGLRVTSPESQRLVKMALNGLVNTRLVRWLVNGGLEAVGLSGVDLGLVRVEPMVVHGVSLGRVGQVSSVNTAALLKLLEAGLLPVISPISLGKDGFTYNVNADHVAAALAKALGASQLVFVSNVPGVQVAGRTLRALTIGRIEELIAQGHITGGMIPKVRSAMEAVTSGVSQAVITDLGGLARSEGTAIIRE